MGRVASYIVTAERAARSDYARVVVPGDQTYAEIDGLSPSTTYNVWLQANISATISGQGGGLGKRVSWGLTEHLIEVCEARYNHKA